MKTRTEKFPAPKTVRYAYRLKGDRAQSWFQCDLSEAKTFWEKSRFDLAWMYMQFNDVEETCWFWSSRSLTWQRILGGTFPLKYYGVDD